MMRLVTVLAVLGAVAAEPRQRRQTCKWYEPGCQVPEVDGPVPEVDVPVPKDDPPTTERGTSVDDYSPCNQNKGLCVPYYLCHNGTIVTDGSNVFEVRVLEGEAPPVPPVRRVSECPVFLDVCCDNPNATPPPTLPPNSGQQPQCGYRSAGGISILTRILNTKEDQTEYGEFPWMAAVLRKEVVEGVDVNLFQCGGSLIHPAVVLTAAHCVRNDAPNTLKVRLGEWDTQTQNEEYPHQDRDVVEVIYHPQFNNLSLFYDVALLFLDYPVDLAPNVNTICLPLVDYHREGCVATGWGKDDFGSGGSYQSVLKMVSLDLWDNAACQTNLRQTRLGQFFRLHDSFVCAGGRKGQDTCKGDGGSPLVCPSLANRDIYVQTGIVAWGIGCGESGVPGVYADVAKVSTDWIIPTIEDVLITREYIVPYEKWSW